MSFGIIDLFFLQVSSLKGVIRFSGRSKLSLRYIRPFEILRAIGDVSYEFSFLPAFSAVHPLFYVSILCTYIPYESHVLWYDSFQLDDHLNFMDKRVSILAMDVKWLRLRDTPMVKRSVKTLSSRGYLGDRA